MEEIRGILKKVEARILPENPSLFSLGFLFSGLVLIRFCFVEQFLASTRNISSYEGAIEYLHNFYFFSIIFLVLWIVLGIILRKKLIDLAKILPLGFFMMLLPPFLDMLKTGGEIYWSFYLLSSPRDLFHQYITFFGNLPSGIVYFGSKIVFLSGVFFLSLLVFQKTKKIWKAVLGAWVFYSILFAMGAFPSLFYYARNFLFGAKKISEILPFEIAGLIGAPEKVFGVSPPGLAYAFPYRLELVYFPILIFLLAFVFWKINRQKFWAMIRNVRLPQIILHSGLFLFGLGLGFLNFGENFDWNLFSFLAAIILLISLWFSWMASVVFNDVYDLEIDKITNQNRPLPLGIFDLEEYKKLGFSLFFLAIFGGLTIGFSFAFLLVVYQFLAWVYSCPPMRLKKIPILATLLSAWAILIALFLGYSLASGSGIDYLSWRIIWLLFLSFTLSLPIKDFKDIEGDQKYQVETIPVIFGEKNGRLIVASGIFVSFLLSVFFLNEKRLFWLAMIFGAVAYLVITNEKINRRHLPAWILGLVAIYAVILAKIVFL